MKTIRKYKDLLRKIRHAEHFQFHYWMMEDINEFIGEIPQLQDVYRTYREWFQREDDIYKPILGMEGTDRVQALDRERDRLFVGVRKAVDMARYSFSAEAQAAAKALRPVMRKYKGAQYENYVANTGQLTTFTEELLGEVNIVHIVTLNLTEQVEALIETNRAFDVVYNERMDWVGDRERLGKMRTVRQEVDAAFGRLAMFVDALHQTAVLTSSDPSLQTATAALIGKINAALNQLALIKARRQSQSYEL